jgi:hypothetical protein
VGVLKCDGFKNAIALNEPAISRIFQDIKIRWTYGMHKTIKNGEDGHLRRSFFLQKNNQALFKSSA